MPDQLQLRGGTTTEHNSFTGAAREVTVDTTKKTLVVHDGSQAGGTPLMKESGATAASSVQIGTGGVERLKLTSSEVVFNESGADVDFRIEGDTEPSLFYVDAGNNRIGINDSTPSKTLDITGEGGGNGEVNVKRTSGATCFIQAQSAVAVFGSSSNHSMQLKSNGITALTIDTSQRVGIGTSSPNQNLMVMDTIANQPQIRIETSDGGSKRLDLFIDSSSNAIISAQQSSQDINIKARNNTIFTQGSTAGEVEAMRIDSSGRVMIGTATGAAFSNRQLSVSSSSGTTAIELRSATNGDGRIIFTDSTSSGDTGAYKCQIKYLQSSDDFTISTNGDNERLRIDSSGNVGIGTTSPAANLHVHTDSHGEGILIKSTGNTSNALTFDANRGTGGVIAAMYGRWNGTTVAQMSFVSGDDGTDKNDGYISFGTESAASNGNVNATERMRITAAGHMKLPDTAELRMGGTQDTSGDLVMFHNGSNSSITNNTGAFYISGDGTDLHLRSAVATSFSTGGSNERMRIIGSSGQLCIGITAGTGLASDRLLQIRGTAHDDVGINILMTANDSNPASIDLGKSRSSGNAILGNNDDVGQINFYGNDGSGFHSMARILCRCQGHDTSDNDLPSALVFSTLTENTTSLKERLIIDDEGIITTCSQNHALSVSTTASSGTNKFNFRGHYSGTNGQPGSGTLSFTVWSNGNVENLKIVMDKFLMKL